MAQIDALIRETITGIGIETTPGTQASTITRVALNNGSLLNSGFARTMIDVGTESPVRWDNPAHALGAPDAGWGPLTWRLSGLPSASRLTAAGSVTALSHDLLFQHAFGRRYAAVGTTVVAAASTTTVVNVASVTGRKAGELVAIEVTAGAYEIRAIVSVGSDDITVTPALSAIPGDGLIVRGVRTFGLAETRNGHLTIEQRMMLHGGTHHEYRVRGAMSASFTVTLPAFGQLATFAIAGKAASFSGPAALSSPSWALGENPADDDMDAALPWTPVLYVDGTAYRCEPGSIKVVVPQNADPIGDGSQNTGFGSFLDTSGRDNGMSVTGEFMIRADSAEITSFEAATIRHALIKCDPNHGAALTTAACIEIPRFQVIERPKPVSVGAGRHGMLIKWKALRDTKSAATSTAENNDLARTPIRFGLI